jgi:hypothetical protein
MLLCRLIYYSLSALHVSGDVFAYRQEHLTVFTVSGNIHQCRYRLVSWMRWNRVQQYVKYGKFLECGNMKRQKYLTLMNPCIVI